MKKVYAYFSLFFVGSLLPFLIVEWHFQDYATLGFLAILASILLIVCVLMEYLKLKISRWAELRNKKIDSLTWAQKQEDATGTSVYYFRNFL
jgi:hypothetical protein